MEKKCTKCGVSKPLTEFYARRFVCKPCRNNQNREYVAAKKAADPAAWALLVRQRTRKYVEGHKEEIRVQSQRYYQANRDKLLLRCRAWHSANEDKCKATKKAWRAANRDQEAARNREWARKNPGRRAANEHIRRVRKRGGNYGVGVTLRAVHARDGGICYLCWKILPSRGSKSAPLTPTVEHVIPVSAGGDHTFANVRLACRSCNSKKHTKLLSELDPRDFPALAIAHAGSFL